VANGENNTVWEGVAGGTEMPAFADDVVTLIVLNRWVFTFTQFGPTFRIKP
jgi:hypothetical protein